MAHYALFDTVYLWYFTVKFRESMLFTWIFHCIFLLGENQNLAKANFWQGTTTDTGRYAKAMLYALFGYQGWSYLNFVVDELKDPRRNLPRGIIMSLVGCTSIYLLTNLAYFSVLNKNEILRSAAVAIVSYFFTKGTHRFNPRFFKKHQFTVENLFESKK